MLFFQNSSERQAPFYWLEFLNQALRIFFGLLRLGRFQVHTFATFQEGAVLTSRLCQSIVEAIKNVFHLHPMIRLTPIFGSPPKGNSTLSDQMIKVAKGQEEVPEY